MRRVRAVLAALVAAAATTLSSPAAVDRHDVWVVPIDSRDTIQWLAQTRGTVFAEHHNRVVGIDSASGNVLWRSRRAVVGAPVAADGVGFVSYGHGEFAAFEARTGRVLWTRHPAPALVSFEPSLVAGRSYVIAMTSLGSGFRRLSAYAARGVLVWQRDIPGIAAAHATLLPNADVIAIVERFRGHRGKAAATFVRGDTGAVVARVPGVQEIVGFTPSSVDVRLADDEDGEARVARLNLLSGTLGAPLSVGDGTMPMSGDDHVAAGDGFIVRYVPQIRNDHVVIAARNGAEARNISGVFAGGPVLGRIFMERPGGLYAIDLRRPDRAQRLVSYRNPRTVASLALDRHVLYVGLPNERRIVTVDLDRSRVVASLPIDCDFFEGIAVRGSMTLVHCDPPARRGGPASTLVGFPRYDTTLART